LSIAVIGNVGNIKQGNLWKPKDLKNGEPKTKIILDEEEEIKMAKIYFITKLI